MDFFLFMVELEIIAIQSLILFTDALGSWTQPAGDPRPTGAGIEDKAHFLSVRSQVEVGVVR